MALCSGCGNENRPGARFCRFCGQPLSLAPEEEQPTASGNTSLARQPAEDSGKEGAAFQIVETPGIPTETVSEPESTVEQAQHIDYGMEAAPAGDQAATAGSAVVTHAQASSKQDVHNGPQAPEVESSPNQEAGVLAETEFISDHPLGASIIWGERDAPGSEIQFGMIQVNGGAPDTELETVPGEPEVIAVPDLAVQPEAEPDERQAADGSGMDQSRVIPEGDVQPALNESLPQAQVLEPVVPLELGALLQGRYRVTRFLGGEGGYALYEAEDVLSCWNCQAVQSSAQEHYCEVCGAELNQKPLVRLRASSANGAGRSAGMATASTAESGEPTGDAFTEGSIHYQVEAPVAEVPAVKALPRFSLTAGYQSDTGRERDIDEDSLLVLNLTGLCEMQSAPTLGFFAVADGIGGQAAGEVASRVTIQSLAASAMQQIFIPEVTGSPLPEEELASHLQEMVRTANQEILRLRHEANTDTNMGSTLTAALVREHSAILANVGDSRTYLMRNGKLSQLTRDHSMVARLVEQGMLRPEEVFTHEKKNVIYRSLGDRGGLDVDTFSLVLEPGDRLLLCSDGLWEMVRDPFIEDVLLQQFDPQQACDRLVEDANLAGGEDNISVIIINVETRA